MRIIPAVVASVLALGGTAHADKAPKPTSADPIAATLTRLRDTAKCTMKLSPWRSWCPATDFAKGTAPALPGKTLVGMTVELEDGKDISQEALVNKATFVVLAIDKEGRVKLTDIKSDDDNDAVVLNDAVIAVNQVFKAREKTAKLLPSLSKYVKTLKGAYATKQENGAWTWTGKSPSQLRKVGDVWVVIERPAAGNGIWVTVLTDAWE